MFIVWGSGMYGKVDEIPGIGHITTSFGHLYYVPLIPTGTYFITGKDGDGFSGCKISLNAKSILKAYGRTALLVLTLFIWTLGLAFLVEPKVASFGAKVASVILMLISALLTSFSGRIWRKASYERASQLANDLEFDERLKIFIDLHYEQITDTEADRRLDKFSASLDDLEDLNEEIAASGLDDGLEIKN